MASFESKEVALLTDESEFPALRRKAQVTMFKASGFLVRGGPVPGNQLRTSDCEQMRHFINQRDSLVEESLQGLIAGSGGRLARLDGFPEIKVILRADWDKKKVALISGGGSGHEPAHAGFVGPGMLTAAVCGDVFASPGVEAVLAAIRAVTGPAGALLVVKNYTGDRLNFGLAAERARQLGFRVKVVMVGDDLALPDTTQARGLAGTLFVHKIAGHLAEQGQGLDQVARTAFEVATSVKSLGLALSTCLTPGNSTKQQLPLDQAELGLGIHGEPGVERLPASSARELMRKVVESVQKGVGEGPFCALLNNLGGVPPLEMSLLLKEYLDSPLGQRTELLIGPAQLMTSYDMKGFSVSLLPLTKALRCALLAEVPLPAWPGVEALLPPIVVPLPQDPQESALIEPTPSSDALVQTRLLAVLSALKSARERLNALDAKVGDGDAGDTFAKAAASIESQISRLPLADPAALLASLSRCLDQAGGSSGILLAILTGAASAEYRQSGSWLRALDYGVERLGYYGGAQVGDRTMLDAMIPALQALKQGLSLAEVAAAARLGADKTALMTQAAAGRSAYLGAGSLTGVVDPGAEAVALALEALVE